jgi:hypothetical protein
MGFASRRGWEGWEWNRFWGLRSVWEKTKAGEVKDDIVEFARAGLGFEADAHQVRD